MSPTRLATNQKSTYDKIKKLNKYFCKVFYMLVRN